MNLSNAVRTAKSVITANSPVLLVGTAIAGVVTTGVLAAKGGYKARGIIDAEQKRREEQAAILTSGTVEAAELSFSEKAQLTWLCYAVPGVTGASTIASVVGVHTIHTKRHAALAGLYAVTTGKLDDYREKAEELMGSKKSQQLNDALAQKSVDENGFESREVVITDRGTELMLDEFSQRYFYGSVAEIEAAFAKLNVQLVENGDASLNDYYEKIGLPPLPIGDRFGWSGTKIEPRFGSANTADSRSAVVVMFRKEPKDHMGVV